MTPGKQILANKVPKHYRSSVLARLLPDADTLARLDKAGLEFVLERKKELEHLIDTDPLRFFQPNPGAQEAFLRCWDHDTPTVLLFIAGNKTGKTTGGAILTAERLYGSALWDRENRHVQYHTPARGAIFAEDFESHEETILPMLRSWLPKGFIKNVHRNNMRNIVLTTFANGSVLHHKTFAQGSDSAEGKDWDFVWHDEPPPQSLYTATMRGLVSTGGRMVLTATLLKEVWVYDERDKPFVRSFQSSIHDNPWLSMAAKEAFLDTLPEEERQVREFGKPMNLTGLVYKYFHNGPPYVVPLETLPSDCPYIIGVDPHERRPVYVEYGFITPQDEVVWFDWELIRGDTDVLFERLRAKESQYPSQPRICIMDPNRGKAKQLGGSSWEEAFESAGYDVLLGDDNMYIGHTTMYSYLKTNPTTGRPRMMWTEGCNGQRGPIYQMLRYSWEDWQVAARTGKEVKEKAKDAHKDFPDIHRYVAMADLRYDALFKGPEILDRLGKGWQGYGRVGKAA